MILTQPLHINYGGVLQAYALQRVLRDMGHDVVTDRHRNSLSRRLVPVWCRNSVGDLARYLINKIRGVTPKHELIDHVGGNFTRFVAEHMECVELFDRNGNVIGRVLERFDTFVVGSDQTWRPSCNVGEQGIYFLDFVRGRDLRRVAYSASFGVDNLGEYPAALKSRCGDLLKAFDAVSLREESGVRLCREEFGVDASHTLDPTLLLERGGYEELCACEDKRHGFVGSYILDGSATKRAVEGRVANALNLYKFEIGANYSSVESWIAAFRDADFIVTDSFHGTVFSIIFERPFISIVNPERGASRFNSLLGSLGLEARAVSVGDDMEAEVTRLVGEPIDWRAIKQKLESLKQSSLSFLREALNN